MAVESKYTCIKYERDGEIGYVTLNRPEVLNAWNPTMLQEFKDILIGIRGDLSCKIVVIKGEGSAFCAGMDLNLIKAEAHDWQQQNTSRIMFDEVVMQLQGPLRDLYRLIWESPAIFIAQLHGYVVESALALAMHCDISVAADDARLFWRSIGGAGMLWHLWPWVIGMRKTKELIFRSRYILGKEAEEMGMINKSVPLEKLGEEVSAWVKDMLGRPREFLYLDKISINKSFDLMGIADSMDHSVLAHILSHLSEPGRAFTGKIDEGTKEDTKQALGKRLSPYIQEK